MSRVGRGDDRGEVGDDFGSRLGDSGARVAVDRRRDLVAEAPTLLLAPRGWPLLGF